MCRSFNRKRSESKLLSRKQAQAERQQYSPHFRHAVVVVIGLSISAAKKRRVEEESTDFL